MARKRLELMTDAERERLLGIAGTKGTEMAQQGAASMQKSLTQAGASAGKAMAKVPDVSTVKTVEAPAEQMEKLPEMKNPMEMQEPEVPGLEDSFREERKRRMRARMFTA